MIDMDAHIISSLVVLKQTVLTNQCEHTLSFLARLEAPEKGKYQVFLLYFV